MTVVDHHKHSDDKVNINIRCGEVDKPKKLADTRYTWKFLQGLGATIMVGLHVLDNCYGRYTRTLK